MYNTESVQSGLLTGRAWDRTCYYIENADHSLTDSSTYGNYFYSTFKYINSSNEEVEKAVNSAVKIPAGSTEYTKTKNIYDLAGNVREWTAEVYSSSRVDRGGNYNSSGDVSSVSYRNYNNPSNVSESMGFRTRLYIK